MSIAVMDFPEVLAERVKTLSFAEPASLDEVDLVIWRPAAIAEVYSTETIFEGKPVLEVRDSQRVFSHTRHWREEFGEFLGRGGTLVVLAPGFTIMGLHTVQDIVPYEVIEALPGYRELHHEARESAPVHCEFGEPFRQFFDAHGKYFTARASFAPTQAQPIATLEGSDDVCAVYEYRHPGRVLVIPELKDDVSPAGLMAIIEALDDLSARLRLDARVSGFVGARPVVTERESALRAQLAEVSKQRRSLQMKESALISELTDIAFFGQLEYGDQVGVIDAAMQVLHALGAYVQFGVGSNDTLMFDVTGKVCVAVLMDDADVLTESRIEQLLDEKTRPWAKELNREVMPIALYIGGNKRGPKAAAAEFGQLRTKFPAIAWLSGAQLHHAYATRDFDFIDQVLEPVA